jgi:hypothetical protein
MTERTTPQPCVVKGCPWRGHDPHACPMHGSDEAWERQPSLIPEHIFRKRLTRLR